MPAELWEHGSDYALTLRVDPGGGAAALPAGATFWHSGRDALRAMLLRVRPRRVFFPSFYCQDVVEAVRGDVASVLAYPDDPRAPRVDVDALDLRQGDAIIVSNTFGLRSESPLRAGAAPDAIVVEDHSHDPFSAWARASRASWAFASLRKWLPLPDGAMLWSPTEGAEVPPPPALDDAHAAVTLERLSGMLLKDLYLNGGRVEKEAYRALLVSGERRMGGGGPAPMSALSRALVETFPIETWRARRRENHARFVRSLGRVAGLDVISTEAPAPFAVTLVAASDVVRDRLRARLIAQRVYPAVLWPIDPALLPGVPAAHASLGERVLSVHCDHRYDAGDMDRVAEAVRRAMEE